MSQQTIRDVVIKVAIEAQQAALPPPDTTAAKEAMREVGTALSQSLSTAMEASLVQTAKVDTTDAFASLTELQTGFRKAKEDLQAVVAAEQQLADANGVQTLEQAIAKATSVSATFDDRLQAILASAAMLEESRGGEAISAMVKDIDQNVKQSMDKTIKHFKNGADGALKFARGLVLVGGSSKDIEQIIQPLMKIQGAIDLLNGGYKALDNFDKGAKWLTKTIDGLALKQALLDSAQAAGTVTATALAGAQTAEAGAAAMAEKTNAELNVEIEEQVVASTGAATANTALAASQTAMSGTAGTAKSSSLSLMEVIKLLPGALNPVTIAVGLVAGALIAAAAAYAARRSQVAAMVQEIHDEADAERELIQVRAEADAAAVREGTQYSARIAALDGQRRALLDTATVEAEVMAERESALKQIEALEASIVTPTAIIEQREVARVDVSRKMQMMAAGGGGGGAMLELEAERERYEKEVAKAEEEARKSAANRDADLTKNVANYEAWIQALEKSRGVEESINESRIQGIDNETTLLELKREQLEVTERQLEETRKIGEEASTQLLSEQARLGLLDNRQKAELERLLDKANRGEDLNVRELKKLQSLGGDMAKPYVEQEGRERFAEGGKTLEEFYGAAGKEALGKLREAEAQGREAVEKLEENANAQEFISQQLKNLADRRALLDQAMNEFLLETIDGIKSLEERLAKAKADLVETKAKVKELDDAALKARGK